MPSRHAVRLAAALTLVVAALSFPTPVLGHAELDTALPADKSTTVGSPDQIVMTFTEELDPAKSSIVLVDSGGAVVAQGSSVDTGAPKTMRLTVGGNLAAGAYTARWTSVSAEDGDVDHGTTTFTVQAAPSAAPSAARSASAAAPTATASAVGPSPSAAPAPAASTSDAVIPIVAALVLLAVAGAWLVRGRSRAAR